MHDRHYATPPDSHEAYRWRLQLLAEETVGKALRGQARQEDAAWAAAAEKLG